MATTPISGTFIAGGIAVEGLKAKTLAGEVIVARLVLGTAQPGRSGAQRAPGTGHAWDAGVSTPSKTSVGAQTATGAGTTYNVTAVGPLGSNAGRATGTGAAYNPTTSVPAQANAGRAAGTGLAGTTGVDNGIGGPLTPPVGTRFSTGQDIALLDGPVTAPAGAVTINPGTNLGTSTTSNAAGTTFYLTAGKHTLGTSQFDQVQPKNGNTYIGAPGAVLDGQFLNRYAFTTTASGVTIRYLEVCNFVSPLEEYVINHDTGDNWTVEYCNVHSNTSAGVGIGSGTVLRYSWLHHNKQYGFSAFNTPVSDGAVCAVQNVLIDHCEIQGNGDPADEYSATGVANGNGRNGAGKFWDTQGMTVTNNWVHHSNFIGIWADTNNVDMHLEGNLIEDIAREGFFYEISYNFLVQYNTFRRCNLGSGLASNYGGDNFPRAAIYISESGSEPRVSTASNTTSEIRFNRFLNNWDEIALWENADRFCNSLANTSQKLWKPKGGGANLAVCANPTSRTLTVTLTSGSPNFTVVSGTFLYWDEGQFVSGTGIPPGTKITEPTSSTFSGGWVDATHGVMSANATASGTVTMTLAAGSITVSPSFYDCRWHTQHIRVHNNQFDHNLSEILGPNNTLTGGIVTGKMAVISQVGTTPSWSPYTGSAIQTAVTFNQDNVWSANTYRGNYSQWMPFDTATNKTFTQWQAAPYGQDAGSTLSTTAPTGNGGGTYYKPRPPTSVSATPGNASARVTFLPPIDTGGDQIIGYTATASPGGQTASAVTGPITVTGLTNTTAYTFTVVARTVIGLSTASTASSSVTPTSGSSLSSTTAPWHPRYVVGRKRTATTAEVSFVPPISDGGSAVTGFTVTASPGGQTGTGTTGPITVTGLSPGTSYTFTATATNAVGTGPPSPASTSITLDAAMVVGVGAGTGLAQAAPLKASVPAGSAAGTGTAQAPALVNPRLSAGTATGTGAGQQVATVVAVAAQRATGTGAAGNATAEIDGGYGTSGYGSGGYGV